MKSKGRMTDELERIWKKAAVAQTRYYPRSWVEVLRKITKRLRIGCLLA
jgi:hypothetical protein